ncbi:MAG: histidine-type phosphatase [Paraclostridium sp.]
MLNKPYLGTEHPYIHACNKKDAPKTYYPFFINHLGRHASRYLTSDTTITSIINTLNNAKKLNFLTSEGEKLEIILNNIKNIEDTKYGLITPLGVESLQNFSKRIYCSYNNVFRKKNIAVSSYATRCVQSRDVFTSQIKACSKGTSFYNYTNTKFDTVLRFFDLDETYLKYLENGCWKVTLENFKKRNNFSIEILSQFMNCGYVLTLENRNSLVENLYKIYTNQFNIPIINSLGEYFTDEQLKYYWENENAKNFLEKGPSLCCEYTPTSIAIPLLSDFLYTSNYAIKSNTISSYWRFAHAETIIPFSSILKIPNIFIQTNNPNCISKTWNDNYISPMGANIMWVFYKSSNPKNPILLKMLYNEQEVSFPISTLYWPYYKWDDVYSYYITAYG